MLRAGTTDWPPEVTSVGAGLTCTCARTWPILLRCDGQHELLFSGHDDRSLPAQVPNHKKSRHQNILTAISP